MKNYTKVTIRKKNLVIQQFENETLVYDLNIDKAFCLNKTSAMIWNLCNGNHSVSEISEEMSKSLRDLVNEEFVFLAIEQFHRNNLLENSQELKEYFVDFPRREIIKKVGLSTLIALPIISSIIAPQSVTAQSLVGLGQNCLLAIPSNCATGNCLNNGGSGICCSAISSQANSPGYTICTTDPTAADFAVRCCSGNAVPASTQTCPVGQTRYVCSPY